MVVSPSAPLGSAVTDVKFGPANVPTASASVSAISPVTSDVVPSVAWRTPVYACVAAAAGVFAVSTNSVAFEGVSAMRMLLTEPSPNKEPPPSPLDDPLLLDAPPSGVSSKPEPLLPPPHAANASARAPNEATKAVFRMKER